MNKKIIKFIVIIVIALAIYLSLTTTSNANLSISTSKSTVSSGESFSVTVSVSSNEAGAIRLSASNGTLSSTYVDLMSQPSVTISCTAGSSGTITINAAGKVANYSTETEEEQTASKSVQITVPQPSSGGGSSSSGNSSSGSSGSTSNRPSNNTSKPTTNNNQKPKEEEKKSSDATLKGLVVEGYDLYPEFDAGTKEYNIKVPNDVTSVNIVPTANSDKATCNVEGNLEDLQVGANEFNVVVTAENGGLNSYKVTVTRAREGLSVTSIKLSYIDEEGNTKELVLNPEFVSDIYKYKVDNLSYLISKVDVDVLANLEEAKIEITGNEDLKEGENLITITVTMPSESEEEDEVLTYEVIVNKEQEPKVTLLGKIKRWFKGLTGTVSTWFNNNLYKIINYSLASCSIAMIGLTVYLIVDYKKYRKLIEKIAEITRLNNSNAYTTETVEAVNLDKNDNLDDEDKEEPEVKSKGRHF